MKLPGSNKKLPLVKRKCTYYLRVFPDEEKITNKKGKRTGKDKRNVFTSTIPDR